MSGVEAELTVFDKWKNGLAKDSGVEWSRWDCDISLIANDFDRHLCETRGYQRLSKALIKAILTTASVARRYNGGGDSRYADKLDFALSIIKNGVRSCSA